MKYWIGAAVVASLMLLGASGLAGVGDRLFLARQCFEGDPISDASSQGFELVGQMGDGGCRIIIDEDDLRHGPVVLRVPALFDSTLFWAAVGFAAAAAVPPWLVVVA